MVKRVFKISLVGLLLILIVGCQSKPPEPRVVVKTEIMEVLIEVPYVPEAPTELTREFRPYLPTFISPTNENAVMALDEANSAKLKALLHGLNSRHVGWYEWYSTVRQIKKPP